MADRPKQAGGTLLCGLHCERPFEEAVLLVERDDGDGEEAVLLLAAVIQEGHYFEVVADVVAACAFDGRHRRGRQR